MNISLKFEDIFTLQQTLRWEFKNAASEISIDSLRKIILDSFSEASQILTLSETPPFSECEIDIRLLMRGTQDSPVLAYFDMSNITVRSTKFSFKLYADVLFPLIKTSDLQPLKSIWVHEIMHMMDYRELLENLMIYREKLHELSSYNFTFSNNEIRKDKHVILLQLMMHFRAEGIATLVEYTLGGSKDYLTPPQLAKEQFNEIISAAISLINAIDSDARQLVKFIEKAHPYAYQIGAGIVLLGLLKKHPELKELNEIQRCLINKIPCNSLSSESIIQYIRSFDSFDFIKYSFDQESLYHIIWELTSNYTDHLNVNKEFFVFLKRIQKNRDCKGFIALLRNLLKEPFSLQQIEEIQLKKLTAAIIPNEIKDNSNSLYMYLKLNPKDEVSLWALTYVYSSRDILDDSIDYFGYIDDLEVLKTALLIIQ